ncbi:serine protease [Halobacteriales archaeon QS_1_68_20]|nr:MAG: serine protease [Halobacteriales archaeon QS_1_68_20]
MSDENITRRRVLRSTAAGAVATGMAGETFAQENPEPLDRTIIGLTPDADFGVAAEKASEVRHQNDFGDIGKSVSGKFPEAAIQGLENHPQVRYVEQDQRAHALAQETPYGISKVGADTAHDNGYTGSGADIAILDTGIDSDHEDLQANLGEGKDFTGKGSWEDGNGHGTHCAGTADAVDNSTGVVGVSTEATLHAGKVLDDSGSGSFSDIAAGIRWAADQGYDVASLSLGGSSGTSELKDAVDYAYNNGVLVVAAAGNDGECCDCVSYPAVYSNAIAVSATDSNDNLASFSSTGPEVEIAAPGKDIYSTYNDGGYNTLSGTSMACPHVSGAGALLMANGYSNTEARDRLNNTADDICRCAEDQGSGRLNAAAALGLESPSSCDGGTSCQNCSGGGGCFITTATAGEGETLDSLRRFRDESMAATPLGRGLVSLYYKISPPIAETLERNPDSRTASVVRKIVDTCADLSDKQEATDSPVESAALGATLTALYMVGITVSAGGHASIRARELLE